MRGATLAVKTRTRGVVAYMAASGLAVLTGAVLAKLGSFQHQLKATLLGGALLAAGSVIVYPAVAFPVVLAFVPFEFPMRLLGRQAGTNEAIAIGLAVVLLPRLRYRQIPAWASWGFGMLVIGSFVSVAAASDPSQALWGAVRWLVVSIVALAAFQMLRERPSAAADCAAIISATAIVVVVFALMQRAGIYLIVGHPYLSDRIDSTFGYYTNFAGYMAISLMVALGAGADAVRARSVPRALLHGGAAIAAVVGVGLSLSRGALLGAAVGALVMVALNVRRPRRALALATTFLLVGGTGWYALPSHTRSEFVYRVTQPLGSSGSDQEHLALAKLGEAALVSHPLGLGYGNFASFMSSSSGVLVADRTFFHSHRLPVQVGLDAGWIGLGGFGLLIAALAAKVARGARRRALTGTTVGFAGAMAAFLAQGWFEYLFDELSFLVVFAALVWAIEHSAGQEADRWQTFS